MLSIIKTAIITIIISFISGVLLDYYRNYAPRIVCNIGRTKVIKRADKKEKVYFLAIKNISKKTIHDLNINITADCNNLRLHNSKITTGLKYDIANENKMYNISVPFLSKNDEFSTRILVEENEAKVKPSINLRSPENFKRIDKSKNDYFKDNSRVSTGDKIEEILFSNKKVIIGVISILVVAFSGIMLKEYYDKWANDNEIYENNNSSNILNSPSTGEDSNINKAAPADNNLEQSGNGTGETADYNNINNTYAPDYNQEPSSEGGATGGESTDGDGTTIDKPASGEDDIPAEDSTGNTAGESGNDSTPGTAENGDTSGNNQSSDGTGNNNSTAGDESGQGTDSGTGTETPAPAASDNSGSSSGGTSVSGSATTP